MRPYLAIIKDSFREAMASRILWILILLTSFLLLVLAPLSYRLAMTISFDIGDLMDPLKLTHQLYEAGQQEGTTPAKVVWEAISQNGRDDIAGLAKRTAQRVEGGEIFAMSIVARAAINDVIKKSDLYDEKVWKGVRFDKETEELTTRKPESLSADERQRRNLLLIQAAFPGVFRSGPAKSISITYLGFALLGPWSAPEASVQTIAEETVLPLILSWLVGVVAIFVAILVTSPIIPSMFEPGSLHLLLSKPVNRSLLFLSKFFGGCAFILLNASYLLGGLWLILGVRFGIWNSGLLLCIPLFLLLFVLYYSVSAVSSVIWRNPIVSVMVTMLFWLACFLVGFLKVNLAEYTVFNLQRIAKIVPAGDDLLIVNESGMALRWNEEEKGWQPTFLPKDQGVPPFIGGPLIYDERKDRLVGVHAVPNGVGVTGWPFTSKFGISTMPIQISVGARKDGWRRSIGSGVPVKVEEFFLDEQAPVEGEKDDRLIAVSPRGIFRYTHTPGTSVFGVKIPLGGGGDDFVIATEDPSLSFSTPVSAAAGTEGRIAVYSGGTIQVFARTKEGKYVLGDSKELLEDTTKPAGVGFGKSILVVHDDGKIQLLDPTNLTTNHKLRPVSDTQPRYVETSPDGSMFAIVYQDRRLWLVDAVSGKATKANVSGQGDISAVAFHGSGKLLVADYTTRVSEYALDDNLRCERRYAPQPNMLQYAYRYVFVPLYSAFPKPGELDSTVQFVLTGKQTASQGVGEGIKARRSPLRPWAPVWTGLIFMVVMLGLACVYIERQEF